jgi:hypothetical protein
VQILHHDHLGSPLRGAHEETTEGLECLAAPLGGAHGLHRRVPWIDGQQGLHIRRDGAGITGDLCHPALDLLGNDGFAIGFPDGELPPQEVHQRMKGHGLPERQAVALVPGGLVTDAPPELEQQA